MDVAERDGEVVFLRKLREGPATKSYGLHVAALAGLPDGVLKRAEEILESISVQPHPAPVPHAKDSFTQKPAGGEGKVLKQLSELDINTLPPLEALNLIYKWKKTLSESGKKTHQSKTSCESANELPLFD